jgi:archaellum biogenesis ATPase FlaH
MSAPAMMPSIKDHNFNPLQFWGDTIDVKREKVKSHTLALETAKQAAMARRAALRLTDAPDLIGTFNLAYTLQDWLLKYGYDQRGDTFRHPNSESGSYSASVKDGRVHTLSPDDPLYIAGTGAHDAFSVFCTLFHNGNRTTALKDAGDNLVTIGSVSYNKAKQIEYAKDKAAKEALDGLPDYGDDTIAPPIAKEPNDTAWLKSCGDISLFFNDIALTEEHVNKMADATFLIPNVIVKGHIGVYVSPANGGKSALFRYFCESLCKRGLKVLYVNVDAGPGDLKRHFAHANEHGYSVIAPDACVGKSASDVTEKLNAIVNSNMSCDNFVFILDTLKKFTDVISKGKSREFYKLLRALSVRGATVCLLGHCNKYKDIDGKNIFEGTADLRNDVDELIYFDGSLNEQTNILEITTRPDKVRADFKPVSFHIDKNNGLKVTPVDAVINIIPKDDRVIVDLIIQAITEGFTKQGEIIDFVKERCDAGAKKIKSKLQFYCKEPHLEFRATPTGMGKCLCYAIVDPSDGLEDLGEELDVSDIF